MPDLTPNNVTKVLVLGFESQVVHAAFVSLFPVLLWPYTTT